MSEETGESETDVMPAHGPTLSVRLMLIVGVGGVVRPTVRRVAEELPVRLLPPTALPLGIILVIQSGASLLA